MMLRSMQLLGLLTMLAAAPAAAQQPLSRADSLLVKRILEAEDRRDSSDAALGQGLANRDVRIATIARRAIGRIRDPLFAARDSLPPLPAPPSYGDPAWRLRYRALTGQRDNCDALHAAMSDSSWHVRLRAADLVQPSCASHTGILTTLRGWLSDTLQTRSRASAQWQVTWQPAAHAIVALARITPDAARADVARLAGDPSPWIRTYVARAAGVLRDTTVLRRLGRDTNDNVKEAAIEALSATAGHAADDVYLAALSARGYQAVRVAALALKGSPRADELRTAALAAATRLRNDSSETSRDARIEVLARLGEVARPADAAAVAGLARDFDCLVSDSARTIAQHLGAARTGACTPLPRSVPDDAVRLALGEDVRVRVTMSSGRGSFVVRLRGDVAPITAARILALVRSGYYNGLTWQRVEPDFVVQGGSPGDNEYVGYPRFFRDELGTVPHVRGTIGMSTRGHDTGDAQWFFNLKDNLRLGRDYTVFAEVVDGIDVVDGVMEGDRIERIEVEGRPRLGLAGTPRRRL